MTAILLALGSSVGYGVGDFLASRVARRVPPVLLVLYSQALQSVVLLLVVVVASQPYSAAGLAWGTAAGASGRRPGPAGTGGHGPAGPRPHRRASQRPRTAGAALAVLGTLVVSAAQAAG